MSKSVKLISTLFVSSEHYGVCVPINNQNQMSYVHKHDYFEIFLVTNGSAIHKVNGKNFNLIKGSLVIARPNDEHCYLQPMSSDYQFTNLIIITDIFHQLIGFLGGGFDSEILLNNKYPPQINLPSAHFEPLVATLGQLIAIPKGDIQRYNTAIKLATVEIMSHFFYGNIFGNKQTYPSWIKHLISEMHKPENYSKGLSAMYEISNYTPEHLCRSFRKYLNTPPNKFLNEIRIEEATQRIIYSNVPIIDVSRDVGFENLSHFYHLFKTKYNMPPGKYRKYSRSTPKPES